MLSHYTSERGFIGIVRSQGLRATDFLSLNDQSEYVYAFQAIHRAALDLIIEKIPTDLRDPAKSDDFLRTHPATIADELKVQVRGRMRKCLPTCSRGSIPFCRPSRSRRSLSDSQRCDRV